jgi:hypothetical protein
MKYYKLLSKEMSSYKDTKWEIGIPIKIEKTGNTMCSDEVLHCYNHPLLAVFLNPIHADIKEPKLFEIKVDEIVNNDGLKFASKSQTLINEIPLPKISSEQRIEIGIKIAKTVYKDEKWNEWADKWLSGEDHSITPAANAAALYANATDVYASAVAFAAANAAANARSDSANTNADVANVAMYAYAYANVDRNEFNKRLIDIVESVCNITENP